MTAIIAPGLFGPAPSAANAPPAPAGKPGEASPFATLLAAVTAATQTDGEPLKPPGGGEVAADLDLPLALQGLWTLMQTGKTGMPPPVPETQITLTPDRIAEAGPAADGTVEAMEALMAQILVLHRPADEPVAKALEPLSLESTPLDVPAPAPEALRALGEALSQAQRAAGGPAEGHAASITDTGIAEQVTDVLAQASAIADLATAESGVTDAAAASLPAAFGTSSARAGEGVAVDRPEALDVAAVQAAFEDQASADSSGDPSGNGEQREAAMAQAPGREPARATANRIDLTAVTPAVEPAAGGVDVVQRVDTPRAVDPSAVASQVTETVVSAVLEGEHEVRLVLNPPDLGTVDIRIIEVGGALRIRLEAAMSMTREAIEQQLPGLQQALEARDLRVERIEVRAAGSASDGSSADHAGGGSRGGQGDQGSERPEWSPLAWLQGSDGPVKQTAAASSDGARLDVLA